MHGMYLVMLIVGCVALGAVCGPAIHTAFAEAKVKVEAKYSTQITSMQTELAAVKLKAENDVKQAKLDIQNDYNAVKARAETAESDLAALKRFLPGASTPPAAPAPAQAVAAAGMAPAPAAPGAASTQS
jgi:hypothetical protein